MEFLPLWLAPWMLSSVLLDLLGVTLVCCMQRSASGEGFEDNIDAIANHGAELMGGSPDVRIFIHMFLEVFPSFMCYLPVALPTLLSFKRTSGGRKRQSMRLGGGYPTIIYAALNLVFLQH